MAVAGGRWEWRYLPTGKMRHALYPAGAPGDGIVAARCGIAAWWAGQWRGTGSQAEYEIVESLRPCRRCLRAIA